MATLREIRSRRQREEKSQQAAAAETRERIANISDQQIEQHREALEVSSIQSQARQTERGLHNPYGATESGAAWQEPTMTDAEISQMDADLHRAVTETQAVLDLYNSAGDEADTAGKAEAQKAYDDAVAAQKNFVNVLERDYTGRREYEYINDVNGAREAEDKQFERGIFNREGGYNDLSRYTYMTPDEVAEYNRLYNILPKYGADYLETLKDDLNLRQGYTMGQGAVVNQYIGEQAAKYEDDVWKAELAYTDAQNDPNATPEERAAAEKERDEAVAARAAYYAQLEKDQTEQSALEFVLNQTAQMGDWKPEHDVIQTLDDTVRTADQSARNAAGAVFDWIGQTVTNPSAADYGNMFVRESYNDEDANFLGTGQSWQELMLGTGDVIGAMIPGWAAGLINPALGYAVQGATSGASAYREAKLEGYSDEQANKYGILTGASEAVLSKLLGGLGGKAGVSEDILLPRIAMWDNALKRVAATVGVNIASEEVEEALQNYAVEPLMRRWLEMDYTAPNAQEVLENALLTAVSSAIMSGGQTVQMGVNPGAFANVSSLVQGTGERIATAPAQPRNDTSTGQRSAADMVLEEAGVQTPSNPTAPQTLQEMQPTTPQTGAESLTQLSGKLQPQFNIDNAATSNYTNSNSGVTMGGVANDTGRGFEADSTGVSRGDTKRATDNQGWQRFGGVPVDSGLVLLSPESKRAIEARGVVYVDTVDVSADSGAFSLSLDEARAADANNGWAVSPNSKDNIDESGTRVYMDNNGAAGFGVTADGDIVSVFSNKTKGAPKGVLQSLLPEAIAAGGTKLDCYGPALARLYSMGGFVPVARVPFNPEYANPGWDESKGSPDIYFMMATDLDADSVAENYGRYKVFSAEELAALPVMEYDEAYAYRDKLLEQARLNGVNGELPAGMGAASAGFSSEFSQWQEQTPAGGFHPVNEAAAYRMMDMRGRAVSEVPKKNLNGRLTSKTASTLLNAGMTTNEFAVQLETQLAKGNFGRMVYTDAEAEAKANEWITARGYEQAKTDWLAAVKTGKMSKDITAQGIALYNNAVNGGDALDALNIATAMIEYSKELGRALQAVNLLNKLGPTAELYQLSISVEMWSEKLKAKLGDRAADLVIKPELAKNFLAAKTDAEKDATRRALLQDIADQMPGSWSEKFQAWRYLAMLGNARTHIRNVLGNAGFAPVRALKNVMATAIESGADFVSGGKLTERGGRTKAVLNRANANDRALVQAASADFVQVEDAIQGGGKYDQMTGDIEKLRRIYKNGVLEWARKTNSKALDVEDAWFSKPAYANALASFLKANNVTAAQFMDQNYSPEIKQRAREYAIKEAQKATYRDVNWLSEALTGARFKTSNETVNKVGNIIIEGVLPFKKTPASVLMRGIEYSPIGLAKGISNLTYGVKSGKVTAAEAIDSFSAGLTGTGLAALGYFLASQMLVTGGMGDDEEDKFRMMRGEQGYALVIGDKSYTIDWLAPAALPFFVGVELYNNGWSKEALANIVQPMLELSMLQSLNDTLDAVSYADNKLLALLTSATTSYLSQFIPTIGGQIERTFLEDTRQTYYRDRDSEVDGDLQYLLYQAANKLPFPSAEYNSIDYIDAWGRTESTGSMGERFLENFVSPGYSGEDRSTEIDDELQRLYDAGYGNVLPERAATDTQIKWVDSRGNEQGGYLSAEEYTEYATQRGQTALDILSDAIGGDIWGDMDDADRAAYIDTVYDYANETAKQQVRSRYDTPAWVDNAENSGLDVVDYLYVVASAGGNMKTMDRLDAINNLEGFSDKQKLAALGVYGSGTAVANYKAAAEAGLDFDEFTDMLQSLGRSDPTQAQVREYVAKRYPDDPEMQKRVYDIFGWKTPY